MQRMSTAEVVYDVLGNPNLQITDYNGVVVGSEDAPAKIRLRSPKALSYMIGAPNSLGLARAYVSQELEVDGDIYTALSAIWADTEGDVNFTARLKLLAHLDPQAIRLVKPPEIEIGPRGPSHRMPFMAAIRASPSALPPVFFSAS